MFALGAFVVATVVQELWRGASRAPRDDARSGAGRAGPADPAQPAALRRLHRPRRPRRAARRRRRVVVVPALPGRQLRPGQSARSTATRSLRPPDRRTASRREDLVRCRARRLQERQPRDHAEDHPAASTRRHGPDRGPDLRGVFNGQSDSNVGLDAGITKDIWTVINPDLTPLQPLINQGDKCSPRRGELMPSGLAPPAQTQQALNSRSSERDAAITGLTSRFVTHPWAVNFLLIVSPLVTWIWLRRADHRARRADRAVAGPGVRAAAGHLAGGGGRRRPPPPAGAARARTG